MASSLTVTDYNVKGALFERMGTGNLGMYAAGGIAIAPSQVGFLVLKDFTAQSAGGYVFRWDKTNGKLMAYEQTAPADAGAVNIPLVEVGATDISAAVFTFVATGY